MVHLRADFCPVSAGSHVANADERRTALRIGSGYGGSQCGIQDLPSLKQARRG